VLKEEIQKIVRDLKDAINKQVAQREFRKTEE
jgi:hypothetical protein